MYSFRSTADFDHKIGYVGDSTRCRDWNGVGEFFPLEPLYEFDDLFVRFRTEIDEAIANETTFDTQNLYVAKVFYPNTQEVSPNYLAVRVVVDSTKIRVYTGAASSRTSALSSYEDCTISDYLDGRHSYNIGRIFLTNFKVPANGVFIRSYATYLFGDCSGYAGTYHEPSSQSQYGEMTYSWSTYTLPSLIPTGTADQIGSPVTIDNIRNQPEIVAKCVGWSLHAQDAIFCDDDGSYDPDPTPPPSPFDPQQDDNNEPGDNPPPSPGPHNREYDPIPIPPTPTVTSLGAGFTTLYVPTAAILNLLADEIFSDNILQILENIFNSPQDMIAGLSIVPFVVPTMGAYYHKVGLFTSSVAMQRAGSQFIDIDCGSVTIDHYYNNFLDTDPFTKIKIWLPYIGYQNINVDDIMGMTVSVKYRCDILSGACIAYIYTGVSGETGPQVERVIAQFSGNCSVQVPVSIQSYDTMITTAINILTTGVATLATGGGSAAAAAGIASSAANNVTALKPDVTRNGTPGSTSGYMGVQKPYIIRFTPRSSIPNDFKNIHGYASNRSGALGSFTGFTMVDDIQLVNVPGTDGEIEEILNLLKGGVFI